MKENENKIIKETSKYLGASDVVNGTPALYSFNEKEMESALEEIYREIDNKSEY